MTADPGDLAEQAIPVDPVEEGDLGEPPIEADPADFVEQQRVVEIDEDYPSDLE
jgi:hypothetical protein